MRASAASMPREQGRSKLVRLALSQPRPPPPPSSFSPRLSTRPPPPLNSPPLRRAPTFKWGITFANIADFSRPVESISTPQQCAVTATGVIWSRFATQIVPVNYNLLTVNAFMAMTGMYQLSRKFGLVESAAPAPAGAVAAVEEEATKVSPA